WHKSGTSGNTVRSFYLPASPVTCIDCHMPLLPSDDQGHDNGFVRSHRFAAANTALPFLNGHSDQLQAVQSLLQDSVATADLFSLKINGRFYGPEDEMPELHPGDRVECTVVVRNRGVGHTLPGGTNDSNELWLELLAKDEDGRTILTSGHLNADGLVDSTAHFWGALLVDRAGQEINKRNAQDWVATVYARAIGPGTAHTVHYRFEVPQGAIITELSAALLHRKFKGYFNEWTFRGYVAPGQPDSLARRDVDMRAWVFDDTEAPVLPITTMAQTRRVAGERIHAERPLWERWNDYGIGLFMEGDTRAALAAFEQVANLAPENPEGSINQARVLINEGQLERASEALDEAERRRPGYLKTTYFHGEVLKAAGRYDEALNEWLRVYEAFPLDRVLVLGIGRLHYLSGRYEEALRWMDKVLQIDPEDLGAVYNRMLALGALGREDEFATAQQLYQYHKDDEDAMAITAPFKQRFAMANREAQPIHEHELWPVITMTLPAITRASRTVQLQPSHGQASQKEVEKSSQR
ncbi:MAG: tetratricopeptide repeat protein, partial [Rhodothermales bacterium]